MSDELDLIEPDVIEAAEEVRAAWRIGVEAIFAVGQKLIEIRERFKDQPGKWSRLIGAHQWKEQSLLPFSVQHCYRLIAIAGDNRLLTHVLTLPADTYALYQLTRLPDSVLADKLADGTINGDVSRSDVQLILNRANRAKRFAQLATPPLPTERVPVLYADPPWQFKVWSESSEYGAALEHYPTMPLDEICALPIGEVCATDPAVLFMWSTVPGQREAFEVLDAWGFTYKSGMAWDKVAQGMGYWVRNQHEILLIATRGDMPTPDPANKPISVVSEPKAEHSRKPHVFYDHIERMFPGLPKRELFGRYWRPGWRKPWGNMEIIAEGQYAEAAE